MTGFFEAWDATRSAPQPASTGPTRDATAYARAALAGEVKNLLAVPIGSGRNHQLNISAMKMGQLVATGAIDERTVTETLGAADGGLDFKATRDTILSGLAAGIAQGRAVPELTNPNPVKDVAPWEQQSDDPFADTYVAPTVGTLQARAASVGAGMQVADTSTTDSAGSSASYAKTADAVPTSQPDQADAQYKALVAIEAGRVRLNRDARRLIDDEEAVKQFRIPPSRASLTDDLRLPDSPVTYRVDQVFPAGANVLLTAQFKTGKTTMINNLTRSLVDLDPFLGRYGVDMLTGRVALFNYEVGEDQYRRWLRDVGITNTDQVVVLNLRGYRLPLTAPKIEDWVVSWLRDRDVQVWIVDPFARASVGIDENSNSEVGRWLDTVDVIKERAGVSELVMPNHTGRGDMEVGDERSRGATRLDDWADVRWILTGENDGTRFFRANGRDVDTEESALAYDDATRRLTLTGIDRKTVRGQGIRAGVLAAVQGQPGIGSRELNTAVTGSATNVGIAIRDLVRSRDIHVKEVGNKHLHYPGPSPTGSSDPFA